MIDAVLRRFRVYGHVNWAIADQVIVSGCNFLTGILLARYLGLEEFGRFTLAWMAVLFFNGIQVAIITSPMMSVGPKKDAESAPCYYGAVFMQQLVWAASASIVLLVIMLLCEQFIPEWKYSSFSFPLMATLLAFQMQDFLRRYFFVRKRAGYAFLNDAVSYIGQLVFLVALFRCVTLDAVAVLWVITGTSGLAVLLGWFQLGNVRLSLRKVSLVSLEHWGFGKWMLASSLMQWVSTNFLLIMAAFILGPIAVGAIKAANNIVGVTHVFFQAMENFAPSQAARKYASKDIDGLKRYLWKLVKIGGVATGGVVLLIGVFSDFLITLIYGAEYTEYAYVLQWFSLYYFLGFFVFPVTIGLRVLEETKALFTSYLWVTVFSLVASYPLILWLEIHGVMIGLLIIKIVTISILVQDFFKRARI